MAVGRVPVFMRVGSGTEHVIGSLTLEAVQPSTSGEPPKVRITGGALAAAELLEAAAAELRRKHEAEQDTSGH